MSEEKPKKSLGCCLLKIFLALVVLGLLGAGLIGYGVYRTASWFGNIAEPAPAAYPPLNISAGENQDVDRIIAAIHNAKKNGALIDESITPTVFNGVIDKIIQGEKKNGKTPGLEGVRADIEDGHFSLAFSARGNGKQAGQFINGKALFNLEVEEGQVQQLKLHSLKLGGQEAPWVVMAFVNSVIPNKLRNPDDADSRKMAQGFQVFKLLKREGDRVHIILDPAHFKENKVDAPNPTTPTGKAPEKNDF